MFSGQPIGYSLDVDADVHDSPGQPAQQADDGTDLATAGSPAETPGSDSGRASACEPSVAGTQARQPASTSITAAPVTGAPVTGASMTATGVQPASRRQFVTPLVSRPLVNPRLRADPRLRVWVVRTLVTIVVYIGFTIGLGWRYGLTAAVIYAAADTIYRSKTTSVVPAAVRVTSAQRYTRRRLKVLQPAGYMALHARTIPGTKHVIDHVVVGPAGIFTLDSQRLDKRLPLRVIGGMLYYGRTSMEDRVDHAKHEAKHAATLIATELGHRVRVRPVMVMYGPSISFVILKVKGVDVFDGSRVGTYFRRQSKATASHRLSAGQIAMVFAAAARALPPIS